MRFAGVSLFLFRGPVPVSRQLNEVEIYMSKAKQRAGLLLHPSLKDGVVPTLERTNEAHGPSQQQPKLAGMLGVTAAMIDPSGIGKAQSINGSKESGKM